MLKETEIIETIGFFATVLSYVTFQLRRDFQASWLRLWPGIPGPLNSNLMNFLMNISPAYFFKKCFVA